MAVGKEAYLSYNEYQKGTTLLFTVKTIQTDGNIIQREENVEIDIIRSGGF